MAPTEEATFDYAFVPSESFAARPFGLTVQLHYKVRFPLLTVPCQRRPPVRLT